MTMRTRSCWPEVLALVLLFLSLVPPTLAQEAKPRSSYQYTFGQQLTLGLDLPQPVGEVKLYLRLSDGRTRVYTLPADGTRVLYVRDLRAEPLEPFSPVTFWWEYPDAWGVVQRTEPMEFLYLDNRFQWQQLQEGKLTVHWVNGGPELMLYALDVARKAYADLEATLQPPAVTEVLHVYIYPSSADLQSALRLAGREWIAGEAHPAANAALVAIPPSPHAQQDMEMLIPHELTHVQLYRLVGAEGYTYLPLWLREGLASSFEQRADPAYRLALQQARQRQDLIPLNNLCSAFGGDEAQVVLAYAQSQSVVTYLRQTYGWTAMRNLLLAYGDGLGCSAGVERALGKDLAALDREWQIWLERAGQPISPLERFFTLIGQAWRAVAPWVLLVGLLSLPTFISVLAHHRKR